MRSSVIAICACVFSVVLAGSSPQAPRVPQTLEESRDALIAIFAARNLVAETTLKEGNLTVRYKTARYLAPEQRKNKVRDVPLREEEGPQEEGILMTLGVERAAPSSRSGDRLPPHQMVSIIPDDLLGDASVKGEPSSASQRVPWRSVMFHAELNGDSYLHVLLSYGRNADRELIRSLLEALGVRLPHCAESESEIEREGRWCRQHGFAVLSWSAAKALLLQRSYEGGAQQHTGWLTIVTKDGKKYATKQPALDEIFKFLRDANLAADGFAAE